MVTGVKLQPVRTYSAWDRVKIIICYIVAIIIVYLLGVILPYISYYPHASKEYMASHSYSSFLGESSSARALFMPTDEESFFKRLSIVNNAKEKIDYAIHTSYNDDGSRYFYGALIQAADRGVKVRMITDGKMHKLNEIDDGKLLAALLSHNNIEFYYYNPFNFFNPAYAQIVMHDKILCVDLNAVIVGGANMGFHAFLNNDDAETLVVDTNTCNDVRAYFEELITCNMSKRVSGKSNNSTQAYKNNLIAKFNAYYQDLLNARLADGNALYNESGLILNSIGVSANKITLIANPIEGEKRQSQIFDVMLNLIENSSDAFVFSPYFALNGHNLNRLLTSAQKGGKVVFGTNSLSNTPNIAFSVYLNSRKYLASKTASTSVSFIESQAQSQIHGKIAVFDNRLSVVGSFNMDERSTHLDTEASLVIDSEQFNADMRAYVNYVEKQSLKVGADNKLEQGEVEPSPVSTSKKYLFAFYSFIVKPFVDFM